MVFLPILFMPSASPTLTVVLPTPALVGVIAVTSMSLPFFALSSGTMSKVTENERKLCLFIHMKMSTKEISNITNQSLGSINVARSRLRQKFGLTGDDKSLIVYLDRFGTADK